jgi:predicted RNase H-like HicB family nuclease
MFKYLKAAWLLLLLTFSSRHRREWQRSMQAIDDLKILGGKLGYLIFEEDGRFVASRVDVDLVSDGATADEALAHLHEAEALYAEEVSSFKEDGRM